MVLSQPLRARAKAIAAKYRLVERVLISSALFKRQFVSKDTASIGVRSDINQRRCGTGRDSPEIVFCGLDYDGTSCGAAIRASK